MYDCIGYERCAWWLNFAFIVVTTVVCTPLLIGLQFVGDDQELHPLVQPFNDWAYKHRFIIASTGLGIQGVLGLMAWLSKSIVSRRPNRRKVKRVLTRLVEKHFTEQNTQDHIYRATLFKIRYCPLVGQWLGTVERSGELYLRKHSVFSIDPNKKCHNTGFAGECWRQSAAREGSTIQSAKELPHTREEPVSEQDIEAYIEGGYLDRREFSRMSVKARVLCATAIKVNGQIWGILVVDTTDEDRQPGTPQAKQKQRAILEDAAADLTILLE